MILIAPRVDLDQCVVEVEVKRPSHADGRTFRNRYTKRFRLFVVPSVPRWHSFYVIDLDFIVNQLTNFSKDFNVSTIFFE